VSRTAYYKLYYFGVLIGLPVLLITAVVLFHLSQNWIGIALILLLVPGRILACFWRELLRGLRLLHEKRYEESIWHTEAFLDELKRRPWIRHMIWLGTSSYSRNPRSLAYNNLGAAEVALDRLDSARAHLTEAIREDSLNPLPFHNLALLAKKERNDEEALQMQNAAYVRGLTFGATDRIVMGSQKRLAAREGRGNSQ
jgi:tetratricopeptide (TPR) repeat protein